MSEVYLIERYADNGELSHHDLVDKDTGAIVVTGLITEEIYDKMTDEIDRLTTENCELLIANKDLREYNECVNGTIRVWKLDYAELESKNASLKSEVENLKWIIKQGDFYAHRNNTGMLTVCRFCGESEYDDHKADCKLKQAITEKEAK